MLEIFRMFEWIINLQNKQINVYLNLFYLEEPVQFNCVAYTVQGRMWRSWYCRSTILIVSRDKGIVSYEEAIFREKGDVARGSRWYFFGYPEKILKHFDPYKR